jgi:hypothetical protein
MIAEKLNYEKHLCSLFVAKLYFIKRRRYAPNNDAVLHRKLKRTLSGFAGVFI